MDAREALVNAATRRRREALDRWQWIGAGASAYALAKSGVGFLAAKLEEGRVAALGELLRALKKTDAAAVELAAERDGGDVVRSRDWEAYRTGGTEELGDLASEFGC